MNATCRRAARLGLLLVLLGVSCLVVGSNGFELLSAEEYQREKGAHSMITRGPGTRAAEPESEHTAGGPLIEILAPDARKAVKAPVDISVRFSPGAGSHSMSIEIADSAGRNTKQAFKFRVEK
jgi:hypothetical protein